VCVCVCVCVFERETERGRESLTPMWPDLRSLLSFMSFASLAHESL
jgi:hypothetical protein